MKKIFFLAIGLIALQGFAQKTVYYFNYSSYTLSIGDIRTIREIPPVAPSTSPTYDYPLFLNSSAQRGGSFITVNPGDSYVLENTANPNKFPFVSIGNTPQLNTWKRESTATSSTNVSSTVAFTTATSQVFHYTKFVLTGSGGSVGGGTLANPKPGLSGAGMPSPLVQSYTISEIIDDADTIVIFITDL